MLEYMCSTESLSISAQVTEAPFYLFTFSFQASPEETREQRLQQARWFKEEGNQFYKEGRFRDAISRYHWALLQVKGLDPRMPALLQEYGHDDELPPVTPEQEKMIHSIQTDCYNNLAGKDGLQDQSSVVFYARTGCKRNRTGRDRRIISTPPNRKIPFHGSVFNFNF